MGLQHMGRWHGRMLRDALVGANGAICSLALYGGYRWPATGAGSAGLILAFAAVLLVHLTYQSLRLRDLLSLFRYLTWPWLRRCEPGPPGEGAGRRGGSA